MLRTEAEQFGVSIVLDCSQGLSIRGNRDRLMQVFLNVCRNGLQAMPDGGKLVISSRQSDTGILIVITDSGHGISPDDMQKIYEPFFTTKARGTGLGLALSKKIIEEHNGSIDIKSSGAGTTVTMVLPVESRKDEV